MAARAPRSTIDASLHELDSPHDRPDAWMSARPSRTRGALRVVLGLLVALALAAGCAALGPAPATAQSRNSVVAYLDGAERQAESADQEREIVRALEDLRSLSPAVLAERRYADYTMAPARWTLAELVTKYFVPRSRMTIDAARFYADASDPRAIAVIDAQLAAVREHRQAARTP